MFETSQFEGMNVFEHGVNVHAWFIDLYDHLKDGKPLTRPWRRSAWVTPKVLDRLLPLEILAEYQTWHDIGKPYCRVVDEEGRQHFPDHAEVSYRTWMENCEPTAEDAIVGELIRKDMLAHTVKGEAAQQFLSDPHAPSLLLTALAEIHSNAAHMGRLDSDGFKIKWKQLDKLGKKIFG